MQFIVENIALLSIPLISAVVGWFTNFLAVKMMFYPIKFVGIRPIFGWQGIIPAKARQMAEIEVELVLGRLLNIREIAGRLDADKITHLIERRLNQVLKRIVNDVMQESAPKLWAMLPVQGKNALYKRIEMDIPNVVKKMVHDFQNNIDEIVDIEEIVVKELTEDPELINEIFLKAGAEEFPFIIKSGAYFGFLFGLVTMMLWYFYPIWWILPVGGLVVGYATNWIALHIIFEPKHPKVIGPIKIQGMFLKRQNEVSRVYAELIQKKLINAQVITKAIVHGSGSAQLLELIELHVNDAIDRYINVALPYFTLGVGSESYYKMKQLSAQRIFEDSEKFLLYTHDYANEALNIEADLREKMQGLSPEDFEGVLRPAYQQDEWKLIVIGSLLGAVAGVGQLYLMGM
ncbi:MAG: DUF445 domain-containing protein [Algicola sp.]|nr:DUF445 domain-containing protein [Algicola sp.]